jgi:hypothetical protein
MHSIRPAAQPSRSRPETDMQCERSAERRAIIDARRERWELDLRVLVSDAGLTVDARDPGWLSEEQVARRREHMWPAVGALAAAREQSGRRTWNRVHLPGT